MPNSKLFFKSVVIWVVWFCATFAGWFVGWMISFWLRTHFDTLSLESILLHLFYAVLNFAFGLTWAALAGGGQAIVLLVQRAKGWFLWGLPTFVGLMVVWVFGADDFWGGLMGSLLAEAGQWLILRRSVTRAGWWIPASALIWAVSLGVAGDYIRLAAHSQMTLWQPSEGIIFGLIASSIMGVGIASAMTLLWIENQKLALSALALMNGIARDVLLSRGSNRHHRHPTPFVLLHYAPMGAFRPLAARTIRYGCGKRPAVKSCTA